MQNNLLEILFAMIIVSFMLTANIQLIEKILQSVAQLEKLI